MNEIAVAFEPKVRARARRAAEAAAQPLRRYPGLKSHISHVVLDSSWENTAAFHFELSSHVLAYAKNDRLDFEIFYEWQGQVHKYIPAYLVRIDSGEHQPVTLILEVKGLEMEQDRAKYNAATRWVRAVNRHGGFGKWLYYPTKKSHELRGQLAKFHELAAKAELVS